MIFIRLLRRYPNLEYCQNWSEVCQDSLPQGVAFNPMVHFDSTLHTTYGELDHVEGKFDFGVRIGIAATKLTILLDLYERIRGIISSGERIFGDAWPIRG